jgi:hypothetical protein
MKNLFTKFLLLGIFPLFMLSCASSALISNGAYSDISLNQNPEQFEIKRLKEIKSAGKTVFGIPTDKNPGNKMGMVVRFNGINLFGAKRIMPVVSLAVLSVIGGSMLNDIVGYKTDDSGFYGEYKLGLGLSSVLVLPVTGALNNQIWGGLMTTGRAAQKLNRELVEKNSNVDVFLNPKYVINRRNGLWTTNTQINLKTMGATLKVE